MSKADRDSSYVETRQRHKLCRNQTDTLVGSKPDRDSSYFETRQRHYLCRNPTEILVLSNATESLVWSKPDRGSSYVETRQIQIFSYKGIRMVSSFFQVFLSNHRSHKELIILFALFAQMYGQNKDIYYIICSICMNIRSK